MDIENVDRPRTIGIIGGGPAGLSIAKMLKDSGAYEPVVFEALGDVGGKSFSYRHGGNIIEMGTCYATFSHKITNQWMKELRMPMGYLGEQRFDGADFMDFVKSGYGPSLPLQVIGYWKAKRRLEKALARLNPAQADLDEAALPIQDWLKQRNLGKIENFMLRSTTNIAYGFIDETPTVQALRWNDMKLIVTGLLKQLRMPLEGWTEFWRRIAGEMDVRLNQRISAVERADDSVTLVTAEGERLSFDEVVCAIPLDEFAKMTDPTEDESYVASSVDWNGYTTTLVAVKDWFTDVHVEAFLDSVVPGADRGQLLSARYEGAEDELGGALYLTGQLTGAYSEAELQELLRADIEKKGGRVKNVILQKLWKYNSQYKSDAIRDGLMKRLETMQGKQRTWYTGAIFSHEAVSHIVNFNDELVAKMLKPD
ncbi:MAG: FAD-dependent oxidoreductase [Henriciella sp.]|uniref:FAD-dependent oxidoreductase n=1 Tax=Henriciella sp. TaxID=1968823 RepID=UPI003C70C53C